MKKFMKFWMAAVIVVAAWLPMIAVAQTADIRQREELHKEAFFDIRVTENSQASKVAAEVAQFMKTHDDVHVSIIGYADRQTGNPTLNVGYARERAERFRNELIGRYGVDPACVTVDSKGDRVQPFSDNDRNRCVIVTGYGYTPAQTPVAMSAQQLADAQRQQYQQDQQQRYDAERQRQSKDTIYISRVDTLWLAAPVDSLKPERAFGLNKAHRFRNWFITFGGGPGIFQGDHNVDAVWKDRLYPSFNVSIGKWVFPALGFRAALDLDMVHNYYNANADSPNPMAYRDGKFWYGEFVHGASPDEPYSEAPWLYKMRYNAWNFHADVLINFSSFMWAPYDRRIWNLIGYAGVGCIANWDNGAHDWFNYALSWNVGIINSFRVAEHLDINLGLHLKEFDDDFNCFRQGRKMDGMTSLSIGATWHFTKRGF